MRPCQDIVALCPSGSAATPARTAIATGATDRHRVDTDTSSSADDTPVAPLNAVF